MALDWINALLGGALIGIAVSLMLFLNGRVTGISGIINGSFGLPKGDSLWRLLFIAGLVSGGLLLQEFRPESFNGHLDSPEWTVLLAGLLVGFGTILGSGCTSGHGVCGISRLSIRSIAATVMFISAGVAAVALYKGVGLL